MDSRGKPLFDLNEPPAEADLEESDDAFSFQPQRICSSSNSQPQDLLSASTGTQRTVNNHGFSHSSTVSGFQPFIRPKAANVPDVGVDQKRAGDQIPKVASPCKMGNGGTEASPASVFSSTNPQAVDREEGEWSDAEGGAEGSSVQEQGKVLNEHGMSDSVIHGLVAEKSSELTKEDLVKSDSDIDGQKGSNMRNLESNGTGDLSVVSQDGHGSIGKHVKGIEASHALKYANNSVKRKIDHHKEVMLGKKRNRQTMFLKLEDVKQAGPIKTSTPRRQNFSAPSTRIIKEVQTIASSAESVGEKQIQPIVKDLKQDVSSDEGNTLVESSEPKVECNGDMNPGLLAKPKRLNGDTNLSADVSLLPLPRQSSWKHPNDSKQQKNSLVGNRKSAFSGQTNMDTKLGSKKHLPVKKQSVASTSYQDTSVERLIREVTNKKFWHNPGPSILDWTPTATCYM